MGFITNLFSMDFAALVPELSVFLKTARVLLALALLAGPVCLLALGALYLFKPAPEANYRYGFRTYYGMGSIEAWQFSQKLAGLIFGALGAVLVVTMLIVILCFIGKDLLQVSKMSAICLLIQMIFILLARLAVAILSAKYFDKDGSRRK